MVEGEHVAAGREGTQVIERAVVPQPGTRGDLGGAVGRRLGQDAEPDAEPDGGPGRHPGQLAAAHHTDHGHARRCLTGWGLTGWGLAGRGLTGRGRPTGGIGHAPYPTGPAGTQVSWAGTTDRSVPSFSYRNRSGAQAWNGWLTRTLTSGIYQAKVADL